MKIYLSSPYSSESEQIKEERLKAINQSAVKLIKEGYIVYSPITHSVPLAKLGLPEDWDYWEKIDREFIEWADAVCVLMLEGWEKSKGVRAEIEIAKSLNKKIYYQLPE